MSATKFRWAIPALLSLCCATAVRAQAPPMPPEPNDRAAVVDTSRFLPRWLSPVYSLGIGWIQTPIETRQRYEAGFGGYVGAEARLAKRMALRLTGEYQMMPANAQGTLVQTVLTDLGGSTRSDTIAFEYGGTGWTLGTRVELTANPFSRLWLQGGAGFAYFNAGVQNERSISSGYVLDIKAPGTNGEGWLWSGGVRYDIDPAPNAPLSIELRWQALDREQDRLQMWRIGVGYRGR